MSNVVRKTIDSTITSQPDEFALVLPAIRTCETFFYEDLVRATLLPPELSIQAGDQTAGSFYRISLHYPEDFAMEWEDVFQAISTYWKASAICFHHLAEVAVEAEMATVPPPLVRIKRRMAGAIEEAHRYRSRHGSPTDNLSRLLRARLTVEEWQDILNEPYG